MNIRGRRVLLRAIEETDLDLLHAWANDPDLWHGLGGRHMPTSRAETRDWIARAAADPLNRRFAVTRAADGALLGTANLVDLDWRERHAFHGMMLGAPDARGQGYGTDTVMAVMRYAFDELGLERLDGAIIEYNEASKRTYLGRCGWREEGRQRRWYFRAGRWWDRLLVGVTRDDHAEHLAATRYWDSPSSNAAGIASLVA